MNPSESTWSLCVPGERRACRLRPAERKNQKDVPCFVAFRGSHPEDSGHHLHQAGVREEDDTEET